MAVVQEDQSGVAVLRMDHGKVNALDIEFLSELITAFTEVGASSAAAVVLTGKGSVFSAGVDLFRVLEAGREYLKSFMPALSTAFYRLLTIPKPVVAAINGHAIAGGHILMAACDQRLMSDGKGTVGMPELRVGVPVPTIAFEILRATIRPDVLQELLYRGRMYGPADALARGLVNEVVEGHSLLDRAVERANEMAAIPARAFRIAKRQAQAPALELHRQLGGNFDSEVDEVWAKPETRDAIRTYLGRSIGKARTS